MLSLNVSTYNPKPCLKFFSTLSSLFLLSAIVFKVSGLTFPIGPCGPTGPCGPASPEVPLAK
jgi:hypothetical protein